MIADFHLQPGLVETNFSNVRFNGDQAKAAAVYANLDSLKAIDIAEQIVFAASRPERVQVAEILVFPSAQSGVGNDNVYKVSE